MSRTNVPNTVCFREIMDKFMCVGYPGVVKNPEKALQTLGGLQKIACDFYHSRNVELSFMPENPYIRPTYSQKKEEIGLTLVVRARRRKPRNTQHHDNTHSSPMETQETTAPSAGRKNSVRPERKALTVSVGGQEDFPSRPSEDVVKEVDARVRQRLPHEVLQNIFDERPLWTRNAILQKCGIEENMSKILLPKYAFYITCGPWGRLWCKFGYDPRKDPKAAQYQTIMCQFKNHEKIAERNRLKLGTMGAFLTGREAPKKLENPESTWQYKSGQLPGFRQMWYSVCDIHLPTVKEMLNNQQSNIFTRLEAKLQTPSTSDDPDIIEIISEERVMDNVTEGRVADPDVGWLTKKILDGIRDAIREDVNRVVKDMKTIEEEQSLAKFRVDEWSKAKGADETQTHE